MPTTALRGYGTEHKRRREALRPTVEAGLAYCSRCGGWIAPGGTPCDRCGKPTQANGRATTGLCGWDLGHDDEDRSFYTGAEHACCNRRAGGRRGGRAAARNRLRRVWSREWL